MNYLGIARQNIRERRMRILMVRESKFWRFSSLVFLLCPVLGCSDKPPAATSSPSPPAPINTNQAASQEVAPTTPIQSPQNNPSPVIASDKQAVNQAPQFDPERLKFSMVALGTANEGWLAYGVVVDRSSTGFDVITADHVLEGRKSLMVQAWHAVGDSAGLQPYLSVTVMHRAPEKDLAWVRVRASASDVQPLAVAQSIEMEQTDEQPQAEAQAVWTYQVRQQLAVFERHAIDMRVTAKRAGQIAPVSYWRLKNRIEPGLSGGALVNAKGQWIGIASGNSQNQAHYVDLTEIINFMKASGLR